MFGESREAGDGCRSGNTLAVKASGSSIKTYIVCSTTPPHEKRSNRTATASGSTPPNPRHPVFADERTAADASGDQARVQRVNVPRSSCPAGVPSSPIPRVRQWTIASLAFFHNPGGDLCLRDEPGFGECVFDQVACHIRPAPFQQC